MLAIFELILVLKTYALQVDEKQSKDEYDVNHGI
jgi:hypothetical protein